MAITERQKARRKDNAGSSDLAVICGVSRYKTPYELWLEKTDKLEVSELDTLPIKLGKILEPVVLDWAETEGGLGKLRRGGERRLKGTPILVHLDAIVVATGEPVEAKTAGLGISTGTREWGDAGDDIPQEVICQATGQLMAVSADKDTVCHVPVLMAGRGFRMYQVPYDAEMAMIILDKVNKFFDCVKKDIPPEEQKAGLAIIKRIKRIPNKVVTLSRVDYEVYEQLRQQKLDAVKAYEKAQAELLSALGDAEAGVIDGTERAVTYFKEPRKGYTRIIEPSEPRVIRITDISKLQLPDTETKQIEGNTV